jgi:hypothetical protein
LKQNTVFRIVPALCLVVMLSGAAARAQMPGFDMTSEMKEYITQVLPPYVGAVSISPETPAAGEDTTVTASIGMIQLTEDNSAEVSAATLYYTTDGGENWEEETMEQDGDNPELWTATIPGQDAGATVDYYVKADNEVSDINFQAMGRDMTIKIGSSIGIELPSPLNLAGFDPEDANDSPFEHLALINEETEDSDAAPQADIREVRFGHDDDNYYIRLKFGKKIDGGTFSPLNARIYLGAFINLNTGAADWDAADTSMRDYVEKLKSLFPMDDAGAMTRKAGEHFGAWFWFPLADAIPALPGIGKIPREAILKVNPDNLKVPVFDTQSVKSKIKDDGTVDIAIKRSALGPDTNMFMMLFGAIEAAGSIADFKNIQVKIPDLSYPTIIKMVDHEYAVGE